MARFLLCLSLLVGSTAQAQRRGDDAAVGKLEVTFDKPVKLGEVELKAGRYFISVGDKELAFTFASSMTPAGSAVYTVATAASAVAKPVAELKKKGKDIEVIVRSVDRVMTVKGVVAKGREAAEKSLVALSNKNEAAVNGGIPEEKSGEALIDDALPRLMMQLKPCVDQAHKARWQTDDPRFVRCVCPLVQKWRLPKVEAPTRMHRPIAPGKYGLSFTATPKGSPEDCRVWVGPKAPEETAAAAP